MTAGNIYIDNTCINGTISVIGHTTLINDAGPECFIDIEGLLNLNTIENAILDAETSDHQVSGTIGRALIDAGAAGNPWSAELDLNQEIGTFGAFVQTLLSTATSGGELSSIPDADTTLINQIQYLFQYFRNKRTVSGTQEKMYKDDDTLIGTSTLNDDGTTFTKGRMI